VGAASCEKILHVLHKRQKIAALQVILTVFILVLSRAGAITLSQPKTACCNHGTTTGCEFQRWKHSSGRDQMQEEPRRKATQKSCKNIADGLVRKDRIAGRQFPEAGRLLPLAGD
jgi:hypothetical protein